jgi:hypothetical protein
MKIKKCFNIIICFVMLAGFSKGLFAAFPLATDDAGVVAIDTYELEVNYNHCTDEMELLSHSCGISFKSGLTKKIDLGLSLPYQVDPIVEDNLGGASIAFKFSLINDILAVTFSNELGEKDYFINGIYTKEFSGFNVHLNAGYLSTGDEAEKGRATYGIAAEVPLGKFEVVGEIQGQEAGAGNGLAGLRYKISDTFFVGAGFSRTFNTNVNNGTAGLHYEF